MLQELPKWGSDVVAYMTAPTAWVFHVFLLLLVTGIVVYIEKLVYRKMYPLLQKTDKFWDAVLMHAVHKPLAYLIWLVGLTLSMRIIASSTHTLNFAHFADSIRAMGIVILLVWFLLRFINHYEKHLLTGPQQHLDKTLVSGVARVIRLAIVLTGVLAGLQTAGVGLSGVVAFGGLSGAAVAFSAKDLLANFFGGLIVYMDRPFKVGDWIRSPDREIEGTVEHIGWRVCRIRTFDKRPIYVPNSLFTTITIENPSRMTNRRIKTTIGLRYEDAPRAATVLTAIETMLKNHPEIDTKQTLMVNIINFGPSSLDFFIYTFTKTTNWVRFQAIQQDVFLKVIAIIEEHGAACAFPTRTLHFANDGLEKFNASQQETAASK